MRMREGAEGAVIAPDSDTRSRAGRASRVKRRNDDGARGAVVTKGMRGYSGGLVPLRLPIDALISHDAVTLLDPASKRLS